MNAITTIPILRIFDYEKAKAFYIDWLGFTIDWEHYFEENTPVYMQVSGNGITLHLTEHHGDGTPGSKVFIRCMGLKEYHKILIDKKYKYNRPGLTETFPDNGLRGVIDCFLGRRISFNEEKITQAKA